MHNIIKHYIIKKKIKNYDVSDVSVEAIGSRTTGCGCATVGYCARDNAKNRSRFFRGSARRRKHDTHCTDARVGTGHVGRGVCVTETPVGVGRLKY